jgi:hypothetical protein
MLDPKNWDNGLRLAHELWLRGCETPVANMGRAEIEVWLAKSPLDRKALRQYDHAEPQCCAGDGCSNTVRGGATFCRDCYNRNYRVTKLHVGKRRKAPPVTRNSPTHPWTHDYALDFKGSRAPL